MRSTLLSVLFSSIVAAWSPYDLKIVSKIGNSPPVCSQLYEHVCGGEYESFNTLFGLESKNEHPECNQDKQIVSLIKGLTVKFGSKQLMSEATERMNFEFEKVRWKCDANVTCYLAMLNTYSNMYQMAIGHEYENLKNISASKQLTVVKDGVLKVLSDIDVLPLSEFLPLRVLETLSNRVCTLWNHQRKRMTAYQMAKYYTLTTESVQQILSELKTIITISSNNKTAVNIALRKLDSNQLLTSFDVYYNNYDFSNNLFKTFVSRDLDKQLEGAKSMYDVKLVLLNASVHTEETIGRLGIARVFQIMKHESEGLQKDALWPMLDKLSGLSLSAPLKLATFGYVLAKELLSNVELPEDLFGKKSIDGDTDPVTILFENPAKTCIPPSKDEMPMYLAARAAYNILHRQKSKKYLSEALSPSGFVTKHQMFFYTLLMVNCASFNSEFFSRTFPEMEDVFNCTETTFDQGGGTCSSFPLGITQFVESEASDSSAESSAEKASEDTFELTTSLPLTTTNTAGSALSFARSTAFFLPSSTKKPPISGRRTATLETTTAKAKPGRVTKRPNLVKKRVTPKAVSSSPTTVYKIPLGPIIKGAPPESTLTINLNVTVLSNNNGTIEFKIITQ